MDAIIFEKDDQGLVTLTIDMPGQAANTLSADYCLAMRAVIARLKTELSTINGVVLTSAKDSFFAGGDLDELVQATKDNAGEIFEFAQALKADFRDLETLGVPVAVAINGAALGGGFEICLACHYRVCLNDADLRLGLPESQLGLLPGGGGLTRLVRLLGIQDALPYLLEAKQLSPVEAHQAGLVDELAEDHQQLLARAKAWVLANADARQIWDQDAYQMPGGTPQKGPIAQMLPIIPAILMKNTKGCYPAQSAILAAVVEGAQVSFEAAQRIESRYFIELVTGPVAKNMIGAFWFQLNQLKQGLRRPAVAASKPIEHVAIEGPSDTVSALAMVNLRQGLAVTLVDGEEASSSEIMVKLEQRINHLLERNRITPVEQKNLLQRVRQQDSRKPVPSALNIKLQASDPLMSRAQLTLMGGATITANFFSPIEKMALVEVVSGGGTSDIDLAIAFDYVVQLGKTAVVIGGDQGSFVQFVQRAYMQEAVMMLSEGISAVSIERAAELIGMAKGPLASIDELGLEVLRSAWPAGLESGLDIVDSLVAEGRTGVDGGHGFYDYSEQGRPALLSCLIRQSDDTSVDIDDIKKRLLFIQSLAALKALQEEVISTPQEANIGSIFGFGFSAWTGGVIQYINHCGVDAFIRQADELCEKYGERYSPPVPFVEKIVGQTLSQ